MSLLEGAAKAMRKMFVPRVQMKTRKPVGQRNDQEGGVVRDGVRDAEEQGGLPATVDISAHRESLFHVVPWTS